MLPWFSTSINVPYIDLHLVNLYYYYIIVEPLDTPSTEPVPTITVEEPVAPSEPANEQPSPAKKRKESKVLEPKSEKALPKHGVEIQGNIHRKKPGIGTRWEKTYCVVTYEAIYFTTIEDRGEYNFMLNVVPDGTTSVSEKAKGHDKHSKVGLDIVFGR